MAAGDEELLADMRTALDKVRATADRVRRRVSAATTTVQDKGKLLSVTVGGQGDLEQLTFHGDAYRRLAPAELAELVVTTTRAARDQARARAMAAMAELTDGLPRLDGAARQAGSVEQLVEGIVGLVSTDGRGPGRGVG